MKKVLIILIIILFIPNIVLCEETSADSAVNQPASPASPAADSTTDNPKTNSSADQPANPNSNEPAVATPTEGTISNEPPLGNIYTLQVSGKYQNLKISKDSPKIKEYRTIPEGFYLDNLHFFFGSGSQELSGDAGKLFPLTNLSQDGYWDLSYRRYGLLDADMGLNKLFTSMEHLLPTFQQDGI